MKSTNCIAAIFTGTCKDPSVRTILRIENGPHPVVDV